MFFFFGCGRRVASLVEILSYFLTQQFLSLPFKKKEESEKVASMQTTISGLFLHSLPKEVFTCRIYLFTLLTK